MTGVAYYRVKNHRLLGLRSVRDETTLCRQLGVDTLPQNSLEF